MTAVAVCGTDARGAHRAGRIRRRVRPALPAAGHRRGAHRGASGRSWIADRRLPPGRQLGRCRARRNRWPTNRRPWTTRPADTTCRDCRRTARRSPIGAPQAVDDEFGVRAGRATVLRVLDNDPSVDCTSVVIDKVSALPGKLGSVAIVAGGSAIQVTVAGDADRRPAADRVRGRQRCRRRGDRDRSSVTVGSPPTVNKEPQRSAGRRSPPRSTAPSPTTCWTTTISPTGDDLYPGVGATDSADEVSFRPDGTITYRNTGAGRGHRRRCRVRRLRRRRSRPPER